MVEIIRIEIKMAFSFQKINKDIIMSEKDEEDYRSNNICRNCEKEIISDKVGDHCHLTDKHRGPAHNKGNIVIIQKQNNSIPYVFLIFSKYNCHLFFKKLVDKKLIKVKFDFIPKTNEKYISVTYRGITFIDSFRFLSKFLCDLV